MDTYVHVELVGRSVNRGAGNDLSRRIIPTVRSQVVEPSSEINAVAFRSTFEMKQTYWAEHDRLFGFYSLDSFELSGQGLCIRYTVAEPM